MSPSSFSSHFIAHLYRTLDVDEFFGAHCLTSVHNFECILCFPASFRS